MSRARRSRRAPVVSGVDFTPAGATAQATGLLGWVAFAIDGSMALDGVTVRRTARGVLALSFPERSDSRGRRRHPVVRPLDNEARLEIQAQVLAQLGLATQPEGER